MLNPPDEGKLGITLIHPEAISEEQEEELKTQFVEKLNVFFQMSQLELTAEVKTKSYA